MSVLLRPRSHDDRAGRFMLVPILERSPPRTLPSELWGVIFSFLRDSQFQWNILCVSRMFNALAKRHAYSTLAFNRINPFETVTLTVTAGEQAWSGVARTKYSVPGRWIRHLDLSGIQYHGMATATKLDSLLERMLPALPYLQSFRMNPSFSLSRQALTSFSQKDGILNLQSLAGLSVPCSVAESGEREVPLMLLLQNCAGLEELELIGHGFDPTDLDFGLLDEVEGEVKAIPLYLPRLHTLSMLSTPRSLTLASLLLSDLPSLSKLIITPYDDIPAPLALSSQFIQTHGHRLRSLSLVTPKVWPIRTHPSPTTLLTSCPNVSHISLEAPLPHLELTLNHNALKIVSIPRPKGEAWPHLQEILNRVPRLVAIHVRDVKWIRKGMNQRAQVTGVQGEMLEWRRKLEIRGIRLLDAEWKEPEI